MVGTDELNPLSVYEDTRLARARTCLAETLVHPSQLEPARLLGARRDITASGDGRRGELAPEIRDLVRMGPRVS